MKQQLKKGPKALVGNKGYRKYLKLTKDSARIDPAKIKSEERFVGKRVLTTSTDLPPDQVALKYKELWRVERVFRDVKSLLETRPVYHQNDANSVTIHQFDEKKAVGVVKHNIPISLQYTPVAQWIEHWLSNPCAASSILAGGTNQ